MRPYTIACDAMRGHGYRVPADPVTLTRPTRNAAGMTATIQTRKHSARLSTEACALSVKGTLDSLASGYMFHTYRKPCPCCGGKGKLALKPESWKARAVKRWRAKKESA